MHGSPSPGRVLFPLGLCLAGNPTWESGEAWVQNSPSCLVPVLGSLSLAGKGPVPMCSLIKTYLLHTKVPGATPKTQALWELSSSRAGTLPRAHRELIDYLSIPPGTFLMTPVYTLLQSWLQSTLF